MYGRLHVTVTIPRENEYTSVSFKMPRLPSTRLSVQSRGHPTVSRASVSARARSAVSSENTFVYAVHAVTHKRAVTSDDTTQRPELLVTRRASHA